MIAEEKSRTKEEVVYTLDQRGKEALSALALKFTKRPRAGKLIINVSEGRVARVHFEPADKMIARHESARRWREGHVTSDVTIRPKSLTRAREPFATGAARRMSPISASRRPRSPANV